MKSRGGGLTHPPPHLKIIRQLIVAAVVFVSYQTTGTTIGLLFGLVDSNI